MKFSANHRLMLMSKILLGVVVGRGYGAPNFIAAEPVPIGSPRTAAIRSSVRTTRAAGKLNSTSIKDLTIKIIHH